MSESTIRSKVVFWSVLGVLLVALLGAGAAFGPKAYRSWKHDRLLRQAKLFLANADVRNATLSLRRALLSNPNSVDAAKLMTELAEASGSANAIGWRARIVELEPDNPQNRLAWANTALRLGDYNAAGKALVSIDGSGKASAGYHKSSAVLALGLGQFSEAEDHFREAVRLEPTNLTSRLNLSVVLLQSTNPAVATKARSEVVNLSTNSAIRCEALRNLAADALRCNSLQSALSYARLLQDEPEAAFSDRFLLLNALARSKDPELQTVLERIQNDAGTNSQHIFEVGRWLLSTGEAEKAKTWINRLDKEVRSKQPVPLVSVECYAAGKDWNGLGKMLDEQNWGELEYYRLALRAKAYRENGEITAVRSAWLKTVKATEHRLDRLTHLARITGSWDWESELEDVLRAIVRGYPSERWTLQLLSTWLYSSGKTRAFHALLSQISETDPTNAAVKNNLAMTSLLLDAADPKSHLLAKESYLQRPDNPHFVSTYAYSLHLQKRTTEALELFDKLKPEQLEDPSVAAYYGIILVEAGKSAVALKYLRLGQQVKLLPEEKSLLEKARTRI